MFPLQSPVLPKCYDGSDPPADLIQMAGWATLRTGCLVGWISTLRPVRHSISGWDRELANRAFSSKVCPRSITFLNVYLRVSL